MSWNDKGSWVFKDVEVASEQNLETLCEILPYDGLAIFPELVVYEKKGTGVRPLCDVLGGKIPFVYSLDDIADLQNRLIGSLANFNITSGACFLDPSSVRFWLGQVYDFDKGRQRNILLNSVPDNNYDFH